VKSQGQEGKPLKETIVQIPIEAGALEGLLAEPAESVGIVVFAHGSGSSRHSVRNRFVAKRLQAEGLSTLLFDLLTTEEDRDYEQRFDIPLLASRLEYAADWVARQPSLSQQPLGLFGASTGAAAALCAAADLGQQVSAVVSRGGRPDLAMNRLDQVVAPTLLIVGEDDVEVLKLNRAAFDRLSCVKKLAVVEGATHLFEEPGTLETAAQLAAVWFSTILTERSVAEPTSRTASS
jgi:putative phosphoribosyl transferase